MPRRAVLFFVTISALSGSAQNWCPPGATWTYTFSNGWTTEGFARFTYVGDTIIAPDTCQLISAHYEGYDFPQQQPFAFNTAPVVTRVTEDLVSILTTAGFDTLYHFGAQPGNGWEITMPDGSQGFGAVTVIDTGTMVVQGVPLHFLVTGTDTIMERFGSFHHFMLPWVGYLIDAPGGPLRCYQDMNIDYHAPWWAFGCESWLGEGDNGPVPAPTLLFPNPGIDHLTIRCPSMVFPMRFKLLDAQSRIVANERLAGSTTTLHLAGLAAGFYAWQLEDDYGRVAERGRWLKR